MAKITRRRALQLVAGGATSGFLTTTVSADERPPERIVGTTGRRGSRAARNEAERVRKTLDFGSIGQAVSGRFSDEAVERLERNPNVRYVEENGRMYALGQETPYGIETVEADVAIEDGDTGDGVSVAILDTGIDADHETLASNLGEGYATDDAACTADCGGGPFGGGNDIDECLEAWDDDNDHGTHCAGTAAAADNGVGVLGVAPDATLHAVKVLACDGSGSFDDIAEGIVWSADQGHEVQSMSLGADSGSSAVDDAIEYAVERNVVLVAAAGNSGPCTDCVGYPARHPEVIAVSATDENDDLASFSSTGPEVELAAPGVDVRSTVPRDDYAVFSGTSMSCPHVSGAAATVIADGTTDREDVRLQLKTAADDIGLEENEQGAGRLNVAAAVDAEEDDDSDDDGLTVETREATDIDQSSATLNGEVTEFGVDDDLDVGFDYRAVGDDEWRYEAATFDSTGAFDTTVDELDSDTGYEFRAIAEGEAESDTGDVERFTTDDGADETESVVVETLDASEIGETSATLGGEMIELEGTDSVDVFFQYGEHGDGFTEETEPQTLEEVGAFDAAVDSLEPDTKYEFRAVAETASDDDEGDIEAFTTDDEEDEEETTAPEIDSFELTDTSNPQWARVEVDWAVSDPDGDLVDVTSVLNDGVDSDSSSASGSSASGTHELRERGGHGEAAVTLTVTDGDGNETSSTKRLTLG